MKTKKIGLNSRKAPEMLEIEIANICNLKCKVCKKWDKKRPNFMSFSLFKKIIDNYDYDLKRIQFCGTCEPLLNKDLEKMIQYVVEKKNPKIVELITNATLLNKERSKSILRSGVNMLRVSIDGADEESYFFIRGHRLKPVLDNVKAFCKLAKEKVFVGVNCVITSSNINKLHKMPDLVKSIGGNYVEFRIFENQLNKLDKLAVHDKIKLKELKEKVLKRCKELDIKCDFWGMKNKEYQDCVLKTEVNINHEGFMTPCYHITWIDVGKRLGDKPFSQHWNSKELKDILKKVESKEFTKDCCCLKSIVEGK